MLIKSAGERNFIEFVRWQVFLSYIFRVYKPMKG
jgi:hypothetical protein